MNFFIKIGTALLKIILIFLVLLALILEYLCKIAQDINKDDVFRGNDKNFKIYNFNQYPKHYSF